MHFWHSYHPHIGTKSPKLALPNRNNNNAKNNSKDKNKAQSIVVKINSYPKFQISQLNIV